MKSTYTVFTSDIHLSPKTPANTQAFLHFCHTLNPDQVSRLYILGDLFDVWVGDDDHSKFNQTIITALRGIAERNIKTHLIVGNRDFLIGEAFANKAQLQLCEDETIITISDHRIILCHGDQLCTDDEAYQSFREQCRTPEWQHKMLSKPLWQRKIIGKILRRQSQKAQKNKKLYIMDTNEQSVEAMFTRHQTQYMIHGHTHRPNTHQHNGKTRWVLDAWHDAANQLFIPDFPTNRSSLTGEMKWQPFSPR